MDDQPAVAPPIDPALLTYLERLFPDQAPNLRLSDKEVWYAAGGVHVVRHLRMILQQQQEKPLETTNVLRRRR